MTERINPRHVTCRVTASLRVVAFSLVLCLCVHHVAGENRSSYDARLCRKRSQDGHCQDAVGGAWNYTQQAVSGSSCCAPKVCGALGMIRHLPRMFPNVTSVADVGGGPGHYLTGFRGTAHTLVTIEPIDAGWCVHLGVEQLTYDIFTSHNKHMPVYDMTMSVEVAEHIPLRLQPKMVDWLIDHSRTWIVFTAAHPGQPGEGHAPESMKTPARWRADFLATGRVRYEEKLTNTMKRASGNALIRSNLHIFRRV